MKELSSLSKTTKAIPSILTRIKPTLDTVRPRSYRVLLAVIHLEVIQKSSSAPIASTRKTRLSAVATTSFVPFFEQHSYCKIFQSRSGSTLECGNIFRTVKSKERVNSCELSRKKHISVVK